MTVLPIYNCYHPVLKNIASEVDQIDGKVKEFVDNMYDTLHNIDNGVGLAANQVGNKNSILIIDMSVAENETRIKPITMINPIIEAYSDETFEDNEGCLSVPEYFEKVIRPDEIQVKYWDIDQKEHTQQVGGFLARVMQHEIDHLNGILFFEKLTPLRKALAKSKLKKIKKGAVLTDYPMIQADGTFRE